MSDAVILAAITGSVTVIVAVIGVINLYLTRNINKKTNAVEQKVEKLATEVDGKLTKLLDAKDQETIAKESAALLTGEKQGREAHKEEVKVIKEEIRQETQIIKEEIKTDTGQVQEVKIVDQTNPVDVKIDKSKT